MKRSAFTPAAFLFRHSPPLRLSDEVDCFRSGDLFRGYSDVPLQLELVFAESLHPRAYKVHEPGRLRDAGVNEEVLRDFRPHDERVLVDKVQ